jgi:hypothetical protein
VKHHSLEDALVALAKQSDLPLGGYVADDLVSAFLPDNGFVIPGWLPSDAKRIFIAGQSKARKSTLLLDLAVSLTKGTRFLGLVEPQQSHCFPSLHEPHPFFDTVVEPYEPVPVVYIQRENSDLIMQELLRSVYLREGATWTDTGRNKQRLLWHEDRHQEQLVVLRDVVLPAQWAELNLLVQEVGAQYVFVDPINRATTVDYNNTDDVLTFTRECDTFIRHNDCAIVLVHHVSDKSWVSKGTILGSSAWTGWYDLSWLLERKKEQIKVTFETRGKEQDTVLVRATEFGHWELEVTEDDDEDTKENREGLQILKLREVMEEFGVTVTMSTAGVLQLSEEWTQAKLADVIQGRYGAEGWSQKTVQRYLRKMLGAKTE